MAQKKKNKSKSMAYKGADSDRKVTKKVREKIFKEPFTMFEKFLIAMFLISIVAAVASFFTDLDIITYITIANYIILGLIILLRPILIIQILRKNTETFDENYDKKVRFLYIGLRIGGVVFLAMAYLLLYNIGLAPDILNL